LKHLGKQEQLGIRNPAAAQFHTRNHVAGDVPADELALGRQLRLRPFVPLAQGTDSTANDVSVMLQVVSFSTLDFTASRKSYCVVFNTINALLYELNRERKSGLPMQAALGHISLASIFSAGNNGAAIGAILVDA
jgi:hypothetical protein